MEELNKLEEIKAELQQKISRASMPESAKAVYREKLAEIEVKITSLSPKKVEEEKAPIITPESQPKKKAVRSVAKTGDKEEIVIDGKTISKKEVDWCNKLLAAWKEKREKAKSSAKQSSKRTPMQQVVSNVGHAVAVAIDNMPAADIKDKPAIVLTKFEKLKDSAESFLESFKDVLGEDFNNAEIQREFAEVEKLINEIKNKYTNK